MDTTDIFLLIMSLLIMILIFVGAIVSSIATYKSGNSQLYAQQAKLQSAHKYLIGSITLQWTFFVIIMVILCIGYISGGFYSIDSLKSQVGGEEKSEESVLSSYKAKKVKVEDAITEGKKNMKLLDKLGNLTAKEIASSKYIIPVFFISSGFMLIASIFTAISAVSLNSIKYLNNNDINSAYYNSVVGAILGISFTLLLVITGLIYISKTSKMRKFEAQIEKDKETIREKDEELEILRKENEELKSRTIQHLENDTHVLSNDLHTVSQNLQMETDAHHPIVNRTSVMAHPQMLQPIAHDEHLHHLDNQISSPVRTPPSMRMPSTMSARMPSTMNMGTRLDNHETDHLLHDNATLINNNAVHQSRQRMIPQRSLSPPRTSSLSRSIPSPVHYQPSSLLTSIPRASSLSKMKSKYE